MVLEGQDAHLEALVAQGLHPGVDVDLTKREFDLLAVLAHPKAAKVLRHAELIEPDLVQRLAALPPSLSDVAGLAAKLDPRQLALLAEAYEALTFQSGRARADAAAARWRRPAGSPRP